MDLHVAAKFVEKKMYPEPTSTMSCPSADEAAAAPKLAGTEEVYQFTPPLVEKYKPASSSVASAEQAKGGPAPFVDCRDTFQVAP